MRARRLRPNLAAGSDLGGDAARNLIGRFVGFMFEANGHDVRPIRIRGDHDLELVASAFNSSEWERSWYRAH